MSASVPSVEITVEGASGRFAQPVIVIGRDPACDLVIADPRVSRRHLELRLGEYGTSINDCETSNGTFYDGRRVGGMLLAPGRVYWLALGDSSGVSIGISTNVPLRGPASQLSRTWSIDHLAFDQRKIQRWHASRRPVESPRADDTLPKEAGRSSPEAPGVDHVGPIPTIHAELFVSGAPAEHRTFTLQQSMVQIGRSRRCDIALPEIAEDTSAQHAELRWDRHCWWVVDVGSTNGTYVEGARVEAAPLPANVRSTIRLGRSGTGLIVSYTADGAPVPEPRPEPPRYPPPRAGAFSRGRGRSSAPRSARARTASDERGDRPADGGELSATATIGRAVECAQQWYMPRPFVAAARHEVGVVGVAGVGKSSLLNALLAPGCQLLPAGGVGSLTALPVRVVSADEAMLRVSYRGRGWLRDVLRRLSGRHLDEALLGQLSLLCTGDQYAARDPEWLTLALRHAMNPDVGRLPDESRQTREALGRLSSVVATDTVARTWTAARNAADFFFAVREHMAGQFSPLCESIELGWTAPLVAAGVVMVDLPGLGSSGDTHAAATVDWLRSGRSALVVCDRAGLPDVVATALRESGFAARWAQGAGELMIAVTKLDLVTDDELRGSAGTRRWSDAFSATSARVAAIIRAQIASLFPEAARHLDRVRILPVSSRELHRLAINDISDRSALAQPAETGFSALHAAILSTIGEARDNVAATLRTIPALSDRDEREGMPVEQQNDCDLPAATAVSAFEQVDNNIAEWGEWLEREGRAFFTRWEPARLTMIEQLVEDMRSLAKQERRELPICLLGNSGVGKSTLINAVIDPRLQVVPQGGVGPLTAQATIVRFAREPYMRATYHGAQRLNQLIFALDRYCERHLRAARQDENDLAAEEQREAELALAGLGDGPGDPEAGDKRLQAYISQARQMICGVQFGEDAAAEVAYLADALRVVLGRASVWGHTPRPADLERVDVLRDVVALGDRGRCVEADANRGAFLREIRQHASGSIAPVIKSLEVGWDSELLRDGAVLVDLPGVGVANDEYRSVTSDWIRRASAVLLVVDKSGVTEPAIELLRTTGFLNALLHRAPDASEVAPLLRVVAVKLDDAAKDERTSFQQQHPGEKVPPWQTFFDDACTRARTLIRSQLENALARAPDATPDEVRADRIDAQRRVLKLLQIHSVSAVEYRKLMLADDEERPRIKEPEQSNIPDLIRSLQEIAQRHAHDLAERLGAGLHELRGAVERGLQAVVEDLEQGGRDQARRATLREQLVAVLTPRGQELRLRQGQLRERLRATVPTIIQREVAHAVQMASPSVSRFLKRMEGVNWSTLRAAVRRGGMRDGQRALDIPNELALILEEPLAVIWNKVVVPEVENALQAFSRDVARLLDEVVAWATSEAAGLDARRVERFRDDVVQRVKHLAAIAETVAESLRGDVKRTLHEAVQFTIRRECQAFVDAGLDVGKGVKVRLHAFLAEAGSIARVHAGTTAERHLLATYDRVVAGIGTDFASVSGALRDVEGVILGHLDARSVEETARAHEEAQRVKAMLARLPHRAMEQTP